MLNFHNFPGVVTYSAPPIFDYMDVRTYEVEIIVTDTASFQSNPENLTVDITWDNEAPVFNPTSYTTEVPELSVC